MKIRRYLGKDANEAILKVKMDLGSEALILNTRKVRQKGLFKFFQKPLVEVLAAVDEEIPLSTRKSGVSEAQNARKKEHKDDVSPMRRAVHQGRPSAVFDTTVADEPEEPQRITELESKVAGMETILLKIYESVSGDGSDAPEQSEKKTFSPVFQVFYNTLIKNEVEPDIAKRIVSIVNDKIGEEADARTVIPLLEDIIAGMIGEPEPLIRKKGNGPTIALFLGPTGVGKTTTLAKIASNYCLNQGLKVGLITADTYRIAAVEQLKTYAEILSLPLYVIYSAAEVKDAIEGFSDMDVILIDTAGRSHANREQFEELRHLAYEAEPDECFLVLSTQTSMRNCREIIQNYGFLGNYKLIFTKTDESPVSGMILNTRYISNRTISYITTGQNVPDDIELADGLKIARNLLGSAG